MMLLQLISAVTFCTLGFAYIQAEFPPLEEVLLEKAAIIQPFRTIERTTIPFGIEKEKKDYKMEPEVKERFPSIQFRRRIPAPDPRNMPPGLVRVFVNSDYKKASAGGKWSEQPVKWSWEVPTGYTKNFFKYSKHDPHWGHQRRFESILFYSNPGSGLPPLICYFDSMKGLLWKKTLPIKEFMKQVFQKEMGVEESGNFVNDMMLSVDGSRLFFSFHSKNEEVRSSAILLMSNTGKMIRIVHLSDCYLSESNRNFGDNFFPATVHHREKDGDQWVSTSLFDRDANLIGNFVNLKGEHKWATIEPSGLHATRQYGASGKPQNFDLYDLTNLVPFRKSIPENEVLDRPK